jgi:hypothetical protein
MLQICKPDSGADLVLAAFLYMPTQPEAQHVITCALQALANLIHYLGLIVEAVD